MAISDAGMYGASDAGSGRTINPVVSNPYATTNGGLTALTPTTNAAPGSPYDAFNAQMSQYFGALDPSTSAVVNVPGVGALQRFYQAAPVQDNYTNVGVGEAAGDTGPNVAAYQAALDAYNKLPDSEKYYYSNRATLGQNQVKGHIQDYTYDPTSPNGVHINGTDFDNTPNTFSDKIFPALVKTFIGGVAGAGALGAAGVGGAATGATSGAADGGLGTLSATDALGEFGGQAALGGTQAGTAAGGLTESVGAGFTGDGIGAGTGLPGEVAAAGGGDAAAGAGALAGDSSGAGITVIGKAAAPSLFETLAPYLTGAAGAASLYPLLQNVPAGAPNTTVPQTSQTYNGDPSTQSMLDKLLQPANLLKLGTSGLGLLGQILSKRSTAVGTAQNPTASVGGSASGIPSASFAQGLSALANRGARTYQPYTGSPVKLMEQGGGHAYFTRNPSAASSGPTVGATTSPVTPTPQQQQLLSSILTGNSLGTSTLTGYARGGPVSGLATLHNGPGFVRGQGTGQGDQVPAMLSPGEFVMDAGTVSDLGDGSSDAGAAKLEQFRQGLRAHKRSAPANSIPPAAKPIATYMGN